MAYGVIEIVNYYNQEVAAEGAAINRLLDEMKIRVSVEKLYPRRNINRTFQQDLGMHMIRMYNRRAREIRENIEERQDDHNIRYYSNNTMMFRGNMISKLKMR